jgi:hypothetical protein
MTHYCISDSESENTKNYNGISWKKGYAVIKKVLKELEKEPKWKPVKIKCDFLWRNKCAVQIIVPWYHVFQLFNVKACSAGTSLDFSPLTLFHLQTEALPINLAAIE